MKEKSFSKKLYHTSREIARGSFRRFTGGSPAFLSVWGGQTEREAPLCNLKLHADPETGCMEFEIRKGRFSFRLTAPYSEERRRVASEAAKKHSGNLTHTIQKDVV